jgi:CheY-like chemotaxis protein
MDVQMPVMDGIEATMIIRETISKTLPVIALTALALKGDDIKFMAAGMSDYLSKPFEENQLLQIITHWLEIETPSLVIK